jgi:acyl dehydratase
MKGPAPVMVGQKLPARTVGPLTQGDVVRFAGACGDFNPLHFDPDVAARAGFEKPIAMGQMTAGIVGAWVTDWCGVEELRHLEVRFLSPLAVGDTLTMTGEVRALMADADGLEFVEVSLAAHRGSTAVVTGTACVTLWEGVPSSATREAIGEFDPASTDG